ncbi:hypothetical protein [Paenibacillus silvisoli]|uniref:hypothetical protein n=1 Tax=Paenibacillus silvisoli TaxID=3110539 RepID=UPI002805624C|nr:hypothetical protein [Paenibacillus silvisoli]
MVTIALLTVYFMIIVTFFVTEKSQHPLVLIFGWLLVVMLHDAYFTLISLNLKLVTPSTVLSDFYVRLFAQKFITPTIVVWAVDRINSDRSAVSKWSSFIFFSAILILQNVVLRYLGILSFGSGWEPWLSYTEGVLLIVITWLGMLAYRRRLRKDGAWHGIH